MARPTVVLKRKTASKTVAKKFTAKTPQGTTVLAVGTEHFSSTMPAPVVVPKTQVLVLLNGQDKGLHTFGAQTLGPFATGLGQEFGLKTFDVKIDGRKTDPSEWTLPLDKVSKIELIVKDSRGSN